MGKISDKPSDDSSIGGSEQIPVNDAGTAKHITTDGMSDYTIDEIEGISAGTVVDGDDNIYILDNTDSSLKPVDIDTVLQHIIDVVWGKAKETSPDAADVLLLKDGGATEKTVEIDVFAEYVRSVLSTSSNASGATDLLDVSSLDDGQPALAGTDYLLITRGTTPKQIQIEDLYSAVLAGFDSYLLTLGSAGALDGTEVLYVLDGGTLEAQTTVSAIATYVAASAAVGGSGTTNNFARWSNSSTLKGDIAMVDSVAGAITSGTDVAVPTTAALLATLEEIITNETATAGNMEDADEFLFHDDSLGGSGLQRKGAITKLWDYIAGLTTSKLSTVGTATVMTDTVVEKTGANGVDVDSLHIKDGGIELVDNVASEFVISEAANDYMIVDTTDGSEKISLGSDGGGGGPFATIDANGLHADDLTEITAAHGVEIDGVILKDDDIDLGTNSGGFVLGSDADGDLYYRASSALARLAKGTANYILSMNSGATAPEWKSFSDTIDIDGMAEISADLVDADLILVDDGGGGTNKSSLMSRVWTYIQGKMNATVSTIDYNGATDTIYFGDDNDSDNIKTTSFAAFVVACWRYLIQFASKVTPVDADSLLLLDSAAASANDAKVLGIDDFFDNYLKAKTNNLHAYDTIWIPADLMTPSETATKPATIEQIEYATNDLSHTVAVFAGTAGDNRDEYVHFNVVMPELHDATSSAIRYKVFWTNATSASASDDVSFELASTVLENSDVLDVALGTPVVVADTVETPGDLHVTVASADVIPSGSTAQPEMYHYQFRRLHGAGGAPMAEEAYVFGILIQYKRLFYNNPIWTPGA